MKKIIIAICLFLFCFPAFAEIKPPEWDEFCPANHTNAQYIENTWTTLKCNLLLISIIGIPYALYRDNQGANINKNNYWYNRRLQFTKEVDACSQASDNNTKLMCYMEVRRIESNKNNAKSIAERPISIHNHTTNYNNNYSPYRYGY